MNRPLPDIDDLLPPAATESGIWFGIREPANVRKISPCWVPILVFVVLLSVADFAHPFLEGWSGAFPRRRAGADLAEAILHAQGALILAGLAWDAAGFARRFVIYGGMLIGVASAWEFGLLMVQPQLVIYVDDAWFGRWCLLPIAVYSAAVPLLLLRLIAGWRFVPPAEDAKLGIRDLLIGMGATAFVLGAANAGFHLQGVTGVALENAWTALLRQCFVIAGGELLTVPVIAWITWRSPSAVSAILLLSAFSLLSMLVTSVPTAAYSIASGTGVAAGLANEWQTRWGPTSVFTWVTAAGFYGIRRTGYRPAMGKVAVGFRVHSDASPAEL